MNEYSPEEQEVDPFDNTLRGFYGEFKSDLSFPLSYIQSSIPIKKVGLLKTTTEVVDASNLDFEVLMQRDIDQERVETIVESYLEKGKNRVLFFPPLLVSLVALDDNNIIQQFESMTVDKSNVNSEGGVLKVTWGEDRFQLVQTVKKNSTGYKYQVNGEEFNSTPYWSVLKCNSNKIALVVIDGQHRLSALKTLYENADKREVVQDISIPICVIFPPDATIANSVGESLTKDLRELFVTINTTAKQVSGHFITLLDDKGLSSHAMRTFCEEAKSKSIVGSTNFLNLVEWNQRQSKMASKVNRSYSITTISILADTLKNFAFDPKIGHTSTLLNLSSVVDFEGNDNELIENIAEETFSVGQIKKLEKQINKHISTPLMTLMSKPSPYKLKIDAVTKAVEILNEEIQNSLKGRKTFKEKVLGLYRETNKYDGSEIHDAENAFVGNIKKHLNPADDIFFKNVFQQGFVRVWIKFSVVLSRYGYTSSNVAEAMVKALDLLCFKQNSHFFDEDKSYIRKMLINGTRILVNDKSKENWFHLILSTLHNQASYKAFLTELKSILPTIDHEKVEEKVKETILESYQAYQDYIQDIIRKDFQKNWRDRALTESEILKFEELNENSKQGNQGAKKELDKLIDDKSCIESMSIITKLETAIKFG